MADTPDKDEKTEAPTGKRLSDAVEKGDVLQSKELGTALIIVGGGAWLALAGPMLVGALEDMLTLGLSFDASTLRDFDPGAAILRLGVKVVLPLVILFGITIAAAVGTPALLGSLGFRAGAFAFKPNKLNPMSGLKRMVGVQGLVELLKSIAKVILLGAVGIWLLMDQARGLIGLSAQEIRPALADIGTTFSIAVLVIALALAAIALFDVPMQFIQRSQRLRMTKQEVKEEHKQAEGSPESKAEVRRRAREMARSSNRSAVSGATVVLTNPTHFAVALRYNPGEDAAPIVVARGRGATAEAIRDLAREASVPTLSYPQLARAVYYTSQVGHVIREDLYLAVATVLAFVFNVDAASGAAGNMPAVDVPPGARFDEKGRPEA